MQPLSPPPAEIGDLANSCVRFVRDAIGLELDYTPDTLPVLDHYLRERASGAADAVIDLLAPAAGAYFGEVVRRQMTGARWYSPKDDYAAHRVEFDPFFLCFNPMGIAREVLTRSDAEDWGAHFQVLDDARELISDALAAHELESDDYYTFSVRFETLEQVADLLGGLEETRAARRHFGPEVYRAMQGDRTGDGPPS
jgi:hypothetical protein